VNKFAQALSRNQIIEWKASPKPLALAISVTYAGLPVCDSFVLLIHSVPGDN
jgi:hypothetical protein